MDLKILPEEQTNGPTKDMDWRIFFIVRAQSQFRFSEIFVATNNSFISLFFEVAVNELFFSFREL
jgi:hypothetical protein